MLIGIGPGRNGFDTERIKQRILAISGGPSPEAEQAINFLCDSRNITNISSYVEYPRTLRNIVVQLDSIFRLAVDDDLINRSPVRGRHKPVCHRKERPFWTAEQLRKILEQIPAEFRCLFICVALTGIRLGELLALKWKYVDIEAKRLQIVHSLYTNQFISM
jgi:integrase